MSKIRIHWPTQNWFRVSGSYLMRVAVLMTLGCIAIGLAELPAEEKDLKVAARNAMRSAAEYFHGQLARHGGYVYYYDLELRQSWGEGAAAADQIWVQEPGTPAVGMAYLSAWEATGDDFYREAAVDAARALVYGQLRSGGWTNCIDFNPQGNRVAQYRNLPRRGKNYSSLDDGQTSSAIRFLVMVDQALNFEDAAIHEACLFALENLLLAQFPCGAFPQVWDGPVGKPQPVQAAYPDYDWRTEGRIKEYWNLYTLNDDLAPHVAKALLEAHRVYGDPRFLQSLKRLGDFLLLAQMPQPQPAWAQQYNYSMQPAWARAFEPPAIAGHESQSVIELLMDIYQITGEERYLKPVPAALHYLRNSLLPDGRLARYYELQSNRPLYMQREGKGYQLTYEDGQLPSHYGWKHKSRLDELDSRYRILKERGVSGSLDLAASLRPADAVTEERVQRVIGQLDSQGRWISQFGFSADTLQPLVGQPKFPPGYRFLSSATFSANLRLLAEYVRPPIAR